MVRVQWDTGSHFLNQTPLGSEVGRNPTVTHTSGSPEHFVSLMSSPSMWYCEDSCPHTGTPGSTETHPTRTNRILTRVLTHLHHAVFWGLGGWLDTCFPVLYLYLWLLSIFRKKTWKENTWQCNLCVHSSVAHLFHHTFVSHIQGFPLLSTLEPHSGQRKTLFRTGSPGSGGWKVYDQTKWVPLMKDQQIMTYDLVSFFLA